MPKKYLRSCEKCGQEYRGEGKRFCSPACAGNVKKTLTCEVCSTQFNAHNAGRRFCSRDCWKKGVKRIGPPRPSYRGNCAFCNKYYEGEGYKYCSIECRAKGYSADAESRCRTKHGDSFANTPRRPLIIRKFKTLTHRARENRLVYPSKEAFINWYNDTPKICYYCSIPEEIWETLYYGKQFKFSLSIDRKDNSAGYELWNMVLACHICNVVKNQFLTEEEMLDVGQRYLKPKWQSRIGDCRNSLEVK